MNMMMKRISIRLIAVLTVIMSTLAMSAQQKYCMDLKDFGELKVVDGVNVIWKCSADSAGMVTFAADPEMVPLILLSNNKNQLRVQLQDTEFPLKKIPTLTVYSNFLSKAENSGDSTLTILSPLPSAEINLRVVGNGTLVATGLHATTVDAKIDTGRGRIILQGIAQWIKLRNLGSGTIEASSLKAEKGSFIIGGTGNIDCWVTGELTVKGLGSGKVYCKGNPQTKNRTLGTVKIIPVE